MNLKKLPGLLLLTATLIVACNRLPAQVINESNFTLYTKQEGLSHNRITGLAQDSIGYIWMSTASGINRFNGCTFVQYHSNDDSLSLTAEHIDGMVWLDNHRLAAYNVGIHIIDTRSGETRNLFIPFSDKQYQYKFNWIMAVSSNAAGDIFVLARSGFYHFDKDYHLVFRFDYYRQDEIANTPFGFGRNLLNLDNERLAIVSSNGIYFYHTGKKLFKKMEAADCPELAEFTGYPEKNFEFFQAKKGHLLIMKPDADSLIYINVPKNKRTVTGLPFKRAKDEFDYHSETSPVNDSTVYITGKISGFYEIRFYAQTGDIKFYPKKYFPSFYCRTLMEDRNHNLWIATNKGLLRQDNNRSYIQQAASPAALNEQFPNILITDLCVAGDKLYVATKGGSGLMVYDRQSLQFIRRIGFEKQGWQPGNIYSIAVANDSTLLVGTYGPLFRLNLKNDALTEVALEQWDSIHNWVADLYKDRKENVWVAADKIYRYNAVTQKFLIIPTDNTLLSKIEMTQRMQEDASGNIWMAGHGIVRYNTALNKFDKLVDSFPYIKIPDREVNSFIADGHNNFWINTNNNGLICYNVDKGTFRHFTRDDGLPDNNIACMIIIGNKLWMATYSGLACLDLKNFHITSFDSEDGFPGLPIFIDERFFYDKRESKLYIGFSNTIVKFDPNIIFERSVMPQLFIESITSGDQKKFIYPGKNFTASWRNDEITVTIGSINFYTNNSQRYAYRIVKDDSAHWQQLGVQNTFSISNLSPGNHRIQVKLFSLNHRWPDKVVEFTIHITPPFWLRNWFIALLAISLMVVIYQIFRWRAGTIRRKEQAKTHIQQLKAEEYKNQYELEQISHFFSSSLAGKRSVDEVLWDVVKNLIGRMNYEDCIIYMWNADKTRMVQKAAHGPKGWPKFIAMHVFDVMPGQGLVGHVMVTKEPLIIADTRKDDRYRVDDMHRLSEMCVPIIDNGELIGIIDSEHSQANHFHERDIKILTTIATLLANKIKQVESEQSLEVKQKELAFINQQLAEAQLSALQTQMNPHFIFNSLNSIKGMILSNEQQKASRYLSKFAHMIRTTLDQSKETFTSLYENLEHLESYLVMEKLRFDDSFTFSCIVEDDIEKEDTLIPTLMIQPLVENAIWHGLLNKTGEKNLTVRFSRMEETISCCIQDNGIGIKRSAELKQINKSPYQSVGLNNLRNRIKILNEKYNTGCTLEINDLMDYDKDKTGTCAVLRFNIILNKPYL